MNDMADRTRTYREDATREVEADRSYKGIREYAKPGNLAHLAGIAQSILAPGASILDLACGAGALSLRLHDMGFKVHSCDYVPENYKAGLPFTQADLNKDFAAIFPKFDCVMAAAIIEHLENPRHFVRECLKLAPVLIICTPNTDSTMSHALRLRFGHTRWFSEEDYKILGHITPIFPQMLRQIAKENGAKLTLSSWSDAWEDSWGWPSMAVFARFVSLLDRTPKGLQGDTLIAVLSV